jgi:hypothetical protein
MPRVSDLTPEEWKEVELLAVAGLTYQEIADRYDTEAVTIRVRAYREKWAVPNRVDKIRNELKANEQMQTNPTGEVGNVTERNEVAVGLAEDLEKQWGLTRNAVLGKLVPEIVSSCAPDSPVSFAPKDLKQLKTGVDIIATLTGQNKPQQAVQVNVWGDGWGAQGAVPVEGESVEDGE